MMHFRDGDQVQCPEDGLGRDARADRQDADALARQLRAAREELAVVRSQMAAANEGLRVANEELRTQTRELMTANRDLAGSREREHARAEALRESEELYRTLAAQLPGGAAFLLDGDLRYVLAEGQGIGPAGMARAQLAGRTIWEALDADTAAHHESFLRQALAGQPFEQEHASHGRHFVSRGVPVRNSHGDVTHVLVVSYDITERKRAEGRLRLLAQLSASLADALTEEETLQGVAAAAAAEFADYGVVSLMDPDGTVRPAATAASDEEKRERLARMVRFTWQQAALAEIPNMAKVLHERQSVVVPEITEATIGAFAADGQQAEVLRALDATSAVIVPLLARGRVLGAVFLIRSGGWPRYDDQDRVVAEQFGRRAALALDNARLYAAEQKAKAEAEAASQAKDQFVALISHELRNRLSAISTAVQLLRADIHAEGRTSRTLEILERNVDLQTRLVNDLLDLSRLQRGKLQLQRAPVELERVVTAACHACEAGARNAGLTLTCTYEPGLWVNGDFDRLQQVLLNLLSNSVKFTPAGGAVRVATAGCPDAGERGRRGDGETPNTEHARCDTPQECARIVVEDTGIGLDQTMLDHLFEMFYQGEAAGQRKAGLGLGLALVRAIAEGHGGRVWAESEGPGKGSRFIVDLPRDGR